MMRRLQRCARSFLGLQSARIVDGHLGVVAEQPELHPVACLGIGRVVDLLKHARNGQYVGGLERLHVRDKIAGVWPIPDHVADVHRHEVDEPRKHVCHRQEEQGALIAGDDVGQVIVQRPVDRHSKKVAVAQLGALGIPSGAGCGNDGG